MDIVNLLYADMLEVVKPILILSGMLSFTISVIVMLVNMLINAFTGKGFSIGLK